MYKCLILRKCIILIQSTFGLLLSFLRVRCNRLTVTLQFCSVSSFDHNIHLISYKLKYHFCRIVRIQLISKVLTRHKPRSLSNVEMTEGWSCKFAVFLIVCLWPACPVDAHTWCRLSIGILNTSLKTWAKLDFSCTDNSCTSNMSWSCWGFLVV